ncbi:sulfatase [Streptomyces gamaensis]|uniref:Sulfatase n=1 Tax=Streptomyces gamaensis TaxID=1763542 RepID=A0ABW0YYY6_9ACTN
MREDQVPEEHRSSTVLRRLPWKSPDGKPCFLSTADNTSVLSRLADNVEMAYMRIGAYLLPGAKEVLNDKHADCSQLRYSLAQVVASLEEVLWVAEVRGERLPTPEDHDPDDAEACKCNPATDRGGDCR